MVRMPLPSRLKSFHGSHGNVSPPSNPPSRGTSPNPRAAMSSNNGGNLVLRIKVIKGRDLAAKDKGGSSDPYLVLTLGDARQSTVSISKTLNPEWNETIELPVAGLHSLLLEVVCWDKDRFGKDYMGEFDVSLEDLFTHAVIALPATWYHLESRRSGRKKSVVTGEILLEFSLHDPVHAAATPEHILQRLAGITLANSEVDDDDDPRLTQSDSIELEDEEDDEDDEARDGMIGETEDVKKNETPEKTKRRLRLARLKKKAKQRAYEFSGLSELAGVLFLEITKIIDLPPERNMTRTSFDMDPFVVTSLGKKIYKTKVIRHNLNPVYDEKLVFQVQKHETKYFLGFSVIDRDKLSGNDFVGTTNFPLENITAIAPEADPNTGIYPLKEPEATGMPMSESKKTRFRLPLSRSSSAVAVNKLGTSTRQPLTNSDSQASSSNLHGSDGNLPLPVNVGPETNNTIPTINSHENNGQDDSDLKEFVLPLLLKHKEKWEDKHKPTLYIKAKYLPYRALRQQFWRAMLRQYDADDSGYMSKVELTTMLDTLGSTLHESTIDGFFRRFGKENSLKELVLSFDQAVMCLEDLLQVWEEQSQRSRYHKSSLQSVQSAHSQAQSSGGFADSEKQSGPTYRSPHHISLHETRTNHQSQISFPDGLHHDCYGTAGEEGETLENDDLAEEGGEEHVVEIRECPICHQPRLTKRTDADIITHIATCASQDWRQVNNIVMAGFVTSSQAQRKWYSKVITKIGYGGYKLGANSANILVQDRITGQISEERMSVYVRLGIRLLYKGLKSRDMEKKRIRKLLRSLSLKQGRKFDDPASKAEIQSFVNFHKLEMSEVLKSVGEFKNFNEFFYRQLKPGARPCSAPNTPEIITSPADCRSVVFNKLEEAQKIWVKGREFSVENLLGSAYPGDAKRYHGGALGIFRLAPQDYHRFHIPVDGVMGEPKLIEGEYYTVNPMAIRSTLDVYGENIRVVVPIDSKKHGRVIVVCVGAMMVGSTIITRKSGEEVARAEELGYFKFGGSTILLLFEPGVMLFDDDLVDNSNGALETLLRVGMSIGHSPDHAAYALDMRKKDADITQQEKLDAKRRIEGSIAPEDGGGHSIMADFK